MKTDIIDMPSPPLLNATIFHTVMLKAEGLAALQLVLRLDKKAAAAVSKAKIQLTLIRLGFRLFEAFVPAITQLSREPSGKLRNPRGRKHTIRPETRNAPTFHKKAGCIYRKRGF